jgi:hypothetical protein
MESVEIINYLFPEQSKQFNEYEGFIQDLGNFIYDSYVNRFIKKQYVNVPVEEFGIMKKCHDWHSENRFENRISIHKVMEIINNENPTIINRMIRRLKLEKNKKLNPVSEDTEKKIYNTFRGNGEVKQRQRQRLLPSKPIEA